MKKSTASDDFSVLISIYAKEKPDYLDLSLQSIFTNSLFPSEVVLIEDGPVGKELQKVVAKYQRKYPKVLKVFSYEKNRGLGLALADGVKNCSYDLIVRMDADDICHKNRFEREISYLMKHQDIDVLGSFVMEYDNTMSTACALKEVPLQDREIKKYMRTRNPLNHMSVVFRKEKVLSAGNYLPMLFFEDYYLWCRMAKNNCHFANLEEPLVDVRSGLKMIERRGGLKYVKCICQFEWTLWRQQTINTLELIKNIVIRVTVCFLPRHIRKTLYEKKLRGKVRKVYGQNSVI